MFGVLSEAVSRECDDLPGLLVGMDTQSLADVVTEQDRALTRLGCMKLVLAAAWADHHAHGASTGSMLLERAVQVGGAGTPKVSEGGIDELGDLSSISNGAVRRLLADVLDLRHRLPLLWARVCRGGVVEWQARKIAQATRILGADAAGEVDRALEAWIGQLPWGRLANLLDAEILAADPELAAALAEQARGSKGVWSGRTDERNIKTIVARTDPVSAAWFMGMVNRIADCLAADGDARPADERRAAAIGILARPADALTLLNRHATGRPREGVDDRRDLMDGPLRQAQDSASTSSGNEHQAAAESAGKDGSDLEDGPSAGSGDEQQAAADHSERDMPDDPLRQAQDNASAGSGGEQHSPRSVADNGYSDPGHSQSEFLFPELVEGPTSRASDPCLPPREPDPDIDEACVAEYRPCGRPGERPDRLPPDEPPEFDPGEPDPHLRVHLDPPAGFDPRSAKPTAVLHFHLSDAALAAAGGGALVRPGQADRVDPGTLADLISWLAGTGCQIVVKPVIDPADTAPADAYEIPDRIRTAVRYRDIADASPWGTSTRDGLDLDHTIAYRPGGEPGQTSLGNLGPFVRPTHRVKTVGAKQVRQPEPGIYLWRSRHGHITLVTNRGSISLGRSPFSDSLWNLGRSYRRSVFEAKFIDLITSYELTVTV